MSTGQNNGGLFAARLKQERKQHSWSQAKLAALLEIDTRTISRWERGIGLPVFSLREKLCELFEQSLHSLGLLELESQFSTDLAATTTLFDTTTPLPPAFQLVGREKPLLDLKQRLRTGGNVALSALNGLPGVGKTALAIALAHDRDLHAHFTDGILWAGLGPEPDIIGHLSRWGKLVGLPSNEISTLQTAQEWSLAIHRCIGQRALLLVIDDVWKAQDALALKVGGMRCAHLVTTRFPPVAAQVAAEGATILNELTTSEGLALLRLLAPQVIEKEPVRARELVQAVGGLALALILMGNYLRIQSYTGQPRRIEAALQRLNNAPERLNLVEPRSPSERHPSQPHDAFVSLATIIAVTDQQLPPEARHALYALALFPAKPNSFAEEAAQAVADCPIALLDRLVDTGLVQVVDADRYTIHQTIADYARLQGVNRQTQERFIAFFLDFLEIQRNNFDQIERETNNILAALDLAHERAMNTELTRLACEFAPFLLARCQYETAQHHLQRASDGAEDAQKSRALFWLGETALRQGNILQAEQLFQEGLTLARQCQEIDIAVRCLAALATWSWKRGEYARAQNYLEEGFQLARLLEETQSSVWMLFQIEGSVADRLGSYVQAERAARKAIALFQKHPDFELAQLSIMCNSLGAILSNQGKRTEARAVFEEGLQHARVSGHREWTCALLNNFGDFERLQGNYKRAEACFQEGLFLARQIAHREWICALSLGLSQCAIARGWYAQAEAFLAECLPLAKELNLPYLCAFALYEYGNLALRQNQIEQASDYFQAMREFIPVGSQEAVAFHQWGLAQVSAATNRMEQASLLGEQSASLLEQLKHNEASVVRAWVSSLTSARANGSSLSRNGGG